MSAGIKALGPTLVVLPEQVEEKSEGGIIISTTSQRDREQMAQCEGVVIDIGSLCWKDQADETPWCSVGDRIVFAKYAGLMRKGSDGKEYRIISDLDVKALIKE